LIYYDLDALLSGNEYIFCIECLYPTGTNTCIRYSSCLCSTSKIFITIHSRCRSTIKAQQVKSSAGVRPAILTLLRVTLSKPSVRALSGSVLSAAPALAQATFTLARRGLARSLGKVSFPERSHYWHTVAVWWICWVLCVHSFFGHVSSHHKRLPVRNGFLFSQGTSHTLCGFAYATFVTFSHTSHYCPGAPGSRSQVLVRFRIRFAFWPPGWSCRFCHCRASPSRSCPYITGAYS